MAKEGDLQVWWIPQVPGEPFYVSVMDLAQAVLISDALSDYDAFQFENRIKPDYCNAGGLETFEDGEWVDWHSDDGDSFDDYCGSLSDADRERGGDAR